MCHSKIKWKHAGKNATAREEVKETWIKYWKTLIAKLFISKSEAWQDNTNIEAYERCYETVWFQNLQEGQRRQGLESGVAHPLGAI